MYIPLLFALFLTKGVTAGRVSREILYGSCYDVQTPTTLDLLKWTTGKWYEIKRYRANFEEDSNCASQVYFLNSAKNNIQINFSLRFSDLSEKMIQGSVNYTLTANEYNMTATFPQDSTASTFDILATDTDNYAIVYSCWQFSTDPSLPEKQERLWVLGRTRTFSNETLSVVEAALRCNGTDLGKYLDDVSQTDCP